MVVLKAALTRGELSRHHQGAILYYFMSSYQTDVPSPGIAACIIFAAYTSPAQFESPGASALRALTFGFNPGNARGRNLFFRGVMTTPSFYFVGQQVPHLLPRPGVAILSHQIFILKKHLLGYMRVFFV